ncbi:hypothetical protein AB0F56_23490, partial [Streptomyces sp. NPDC026092]
MPGPPPTRREGPTPPSQSPSPHPPGARHPPDRSDTRPPPHRAAGRPHAGAIPGPHPTGPQAGLATAAIPGLPRGHAPGRPPSKSRRPEGVRQGRSLRSRRLRRFRSAPTFSKFQGKTVGGVQVQVHDRAAFDPVRTG